MSNSRVKRLSISLADRDALQAIYRSRHEVYAVELDQYPKRPDGVLPDHSNVHSLYIVARIGDELAGFVGITPPDSPAFSVDHYLTRDQIPFAFDPHVYEVRALTVLKPFRGQITAFALMYAALRWVQANGGTRIVSLGRREVLKMYLRAGLERVGPSFVSGAVNYELMTAEINRLQEHADRFKSYLTRLEPFIDWQLDIPFRRPMDCAHGGAFFDAIGDTFDDLQRRHDVISADVLDAWFPPAPIIRETMEKHLEWIISTSPPTRADGLIRVIAQTRGVAPECVAVGGGSSDLIFLALRQWLTPSSRVLVLDPMYGEYTHLLENLIHCRIERFHLDRSAGYRVDTERLTQTLAEGFDLFIWVNPNSPTGLHVSKADTERVLSQLPDRTRVWIDETYVEYAGRDQSLEGFAVRSRNVLVCKSLSKVYALSGLRAGYLCGSARSIAEFKALTPPWAVSLPAQIAAILALQAPDYYSMRYRQTHELRDGLVEGLMRLGISEIIPGIANFIMFHLPEDGPDAETVEARSRAHGLYVRNVSNMGYGMGRFAMRIAVKDADTNQRMLGILATAMSSVSGSLSGSE